MKNLSSHRDRAYKLALIAIMAATLEAGKLALSFIPNVEMVTLLCAVYGYIFGYYGVIATYIFVGIETLIWGVNTWVVTYLVHWGVVALVFMLFGKFKIKNRFVVTGAAVLLTTAFGVLSSLVDTGLLTGFFDSFWKRFAIIYVRGIAFYVTQIVCNLLLFLVVFNPMVNSLQKILPEKFEIRSK